VLTGPESTGKSALTVHLSRHLIASSMTAAMAWDGSGAGTRPSLRANSTAGLEHLRCGTATCVDQAELLSAWLTIGAMPW
jgi:hypothetical protein